ncbi:ABC transporter permease [Alloacidobacterium sp.]|uniref:ABC transporter permease n=1 Tax=Alloacidobacterium sp. TaxID=2951999 RepID=UPI002D663D79|nr:ABC transporter permease [Alloacidobacterium sp.]HYK38289.1 ABC transporter permease [Alloacidobacterium sp.]
MHTFLQDIRYAFRQLRAHPGFALTAIMSLALGIGATVSVFSIIYGALINPWPYAGADRICLPLLADRAGGENLVLPTWPQIHVLRQSPVVEGVLGVDERDMMATGQDVPEDVYAVDTPNDTFAFLGVPPMLGRVFTPADAPDGKAPPVAVLGNSFWQRYYNGDPGVVGRTIQLNHRSYTILGVMPPRFTWIDGDVYLPLDPARDQNANYFTVAKLKPGITYAAAEAALAPLFQSFAKENPIQFPKDFKLRLRGLGYGSYMRLGSTLNLLFGGVALLMLVGCGNVSILLLARGIARQHEFAVRSAIGASRFRLVRQLLTESLLLALTGAGLGVLLAYQSVGLIVARLPEYSFPHEADFHLNLPVLFFSVGIAVLTGILFGLFPALQMARPNISTVMQSATRKAAGTARGKYLHTTLIAGQIALTLLLLTAAGAAIEGFLGTMRVPLGFDPHHVVSVGIPLHENTFTTRGERTRYYELLRERITEMPGVLAAGISTNATPPNNGSREPIEILGRTPDDQQEAKANFVDSQYFQTLRISLRQGRLWSPAETMRGAVLAVVNQAFIRRYFPNGDALGHSVRLPRLQNKPPSSLLAPGGDGWLQIIGIVGDAMNDGLDRPVQPAVFAPYTLQMPMYTHILARTQGDPLAMLRDIQQQIAAVNPDQQISGETSGAVKDLDGWLRRQPEWARGRLVSMLITAFSILAMALGAVGLYSVTSYTVAQRTSEYGIRMALGAPRRHVLKIVFASAGVSVGLGIGAGLVLSFGLTRVMTRWIDHGSVDPLLVLSVSFLLIVVAVMACLAPARRASSVDPITALRCE